MGRSTANIMENENGMISHSKFFGTQILADDHRFYYLNG
jgi:hypothetical protein